VHCANYRTIFTDNSDDANVSVLCHNAVRSLELFVIFLRSCAIAIACCCRCRLLLSWFSVTDGLVMVTGTSFAVSVVILRRCWRRKMTCRCLVRTLTRRAGPPSPFLRSLLRFLGRRCIPPGTLARLLSATVARMPGCSRRPRRGLLESRCRRRIRLGGSSVAIHWRQCYHLYAVDRARLID